MNSFPFITGSVSSIQNLAQQGRSHLCSFLVELDTHDGPVSLLLTSNTYVYDCHSLEQGDQITAFYDPNVPMPLIYPPRYTALVIAETGTGTTAVLDVFDENLLNSDGTLRLTPQPDTDITTPNGQKLSQIPGGSLLLALYTASTKSIPALAVPEEVVIFCTE